MHYMNEEHQQNLESLLQIFPIEDKQRTAILYLFAVPSVYRAFQEEFEKQDTPISIAVSFLDNEMPHISLSSGETKLVQLAIMLYNGETHVEKGGFDLYKSLFWWDDEHVKVFYEALSIVRPVLQK